MSSYQASQPFILLDPSTAGKQGAECLRLAMISTACQKDFGLVKEEIQNWGQRMKGQHLLQIELEPVDFQHADKEPGIVLNTLLCRAKLAANNLGATLNHAKRTRWTTSKASIGCQPQQVPCPLITKHRYGEKSLVSNSLLHRNWLATLQKDESFAALSRWLCQVSFLL